MVTLRAKKLSDGRFHLYIDSYKDGQRKKQYLEIYVSEDYTSPVKDKTGKNQYDENGKLKFRSVNREDKVNWKIAQKAKTSIENEVNNDRYGFNENIKKNSDFSKYFSGYVDDYNKIRKRVADASYNAFQKFNDDKNVLANQISEDYARKFADFLEKKYKGETPCAYFQVFKQVVKRAHKDGLLKANFTEDVKVQRKSGEEKDVLNINELRLLFKTPLYNTEVKRAFLFSCYTGLDFNDVKLYFRWSNVKELSAGLMISGNRGKTGKAYAIKLTQDAAKLIGQRKKPNDLVFDMPTHNGTVKSLKKWAEDAGINKHLTYHCARHTFGTLSMFYGGDIKATSKLMTHSKLTETDRYARLAESMKNEVLDKLPSLSE